MQGRREDGQDSTRRDELLIEQDIPRREQVSV